MPDSPPPTPLYTRRAERRGWPVWRARLLRLARMPGLGSLMAIALLAAALAFGAGLGGEYEAFVAANGSLPNVAARALGFGVDAVTINGLRELTPKEVLKAAGVDPRGSLLFADAAAMRDRLLALPLIKEASVHKLFPDRLVIDVTERRAFALWQKDGVVDVISADGMPIDKLRDGRFADLPFVVGDDANEHVDEFIKLLSVAGDLKDQIRAGVYVGERRWDVNLKNGMIVRLPEDHPGQAFAEFVKLADQYQLLDKDLLTIDMRFPGRMVVRISEEAKAAREKMLAKKHKGGAM